MYDYDQFDKSYEYAVHFLDSTETYVGSCVDKLKNPGFHSCSDKVDANIINVKSKSTSDAPLVFTEILAYEHYYI